jgi:hypothetical protein
LMGGRGWSVRLKFAGASNPQKKSKLADMPRSYS